MTRALPAEQADQPVIILNGECGLATNLTTFQMVLELVPLGPLHES
jgi:hypothetical protein